MSKRLFTILSLLILLSACSRQHHTYLTGYIEGDYIYLASSISGTLLTLNVTEGQVVPKGHLLFQLDPQPETYMVESAKTTIAQLQAEAQFASIQLSRQKKLYLKNATDKAALDEAQTTYDSQWQKLQAAITQLKQSQWALNQKTVVAPVEGEIFDTFFRVGEKVAANIPVLALLPPSNIYVVFYIPETKLGTIHIGQAITISCDNCKGKTTVNIYYISPEAEYTPPIIYTTTTRNKLVYQVRANILEKLAPDFHPGQPIDIDLTHE